METVVVSLMITSLVMILIVGLGILLFIAGSDERRW